jgi:hypothetical protein
MAQEDAGAAAFPLYNALPVNPADEEYRRNRHDWTQHVLKEFEEGLEWCVSQGTKHYLDRHIERGLLLGTTTTCPPL